MAGEWQALSSSMIDGMNYDPETEELQLRFSNGAVYAYSGVPQSTADALSRAPSAGSYFHRSIKGVYPDTQVA